MPLFRFSAIIQIRGINPYILVSAAQAQQIKANWRKPMPVLVQINGQPVKPWSINMMPAGNGDFSLYLYGSVRAASKTQVGDKVEVFVAFDASYRNSPQRLPAVHRTTMQKNPDAMKAWKVLQPSQKKEIVQYFLALKSPGARQCNLAKILRVLSGSQERFMARDWNTDKGRT